MSRLVLLLQKEMQLLCKSSSIPFLGLSSFGLLFLMVSFLGVEISSSLLVGLLWITLMLSLIPCAQAVFLEDVREGIISAMTLNGVSPEILVLVKILSVWLGVCIPIISLAVFVLFVFSMDPILAWWTLVAMLLGSIALSSLACLGSIMTLSLKTAAALLPLLVIPLYVPILALGTAMVKAMTLNLPFGVYIFLLLAIGLVSLVAIPFAGGFVVRESL